MAKHNQNRASLLGWLAAFRLAGAEARSRLVNRIMSFSPSLAICRPLRTVTA